MRGTGHGEAVQAGQGMARTVAARRGGLGWEWRGQFRPGGLGKAVAARLGETRRGLAWRGGLGKPWMAR